MNFPPLGNPSAVPLYRCTDCGFVTTSSLENAVAAHEQGSPDCEGPVELIADFARSPSVVSPASRRRRRESSDGVAGQPGAPARAERLGRP